MEENLEKKEPITVKPFRKSEHEDIRIDNLVPFADHIFKPYEGKQLEAMVDSISVSGVIEPIIVRPQGENYEILSGHNRVAAAKIAGKETVPAIVKKDLTDDDARLIVTVTNLIQRSFSDLSHSERAAALADYYDARKSQGMRTDLLDSFNIFLNEGSDETSDPSGQKLTIKKKKSARDMVASTYGLGGTVVARYLRINKLIPELKSHLDKKTIPLRAAVELSYLSADEQRIINKLLDSDSDLTIDVSQAEKLREESSQKKLTETAVKKILKKKRSVKVYKSLRFHTNIIEQYFNDKEDEEIEDTIAKALKQYFENNPE